MQGFFWITPNAQETKAKTYKEDYIKLKKVLHSKGKNLHSEEPTYRLRDNIH
jgi:hypothetical protein